MSWQRAIILIESGGCGVQRRNKWGASHRVVGCIYCFGVHFGVQIPGVVTTKRSRNDRTDEDFYEIKRPRGVSIFENYISPLVGRLIQLSEICENASQYLFPNSLNVISIS